MAVKRRRKKASNLSASDKKIKAKRINITSDFDKRTRAQRKTEAEKTQAEMDQRWVDIDKVVKRKAKDEITAVLYRKHNPLHIKPIEKETSKERLIKDHLDQDLINNTIPKIISGYNGKFEAKVDEILARIVSERVLNKVKVVHRKVLLKDFKIKDLLHGDLKGWSMIYSSYDLRNVLKIKEHYFLFEKVKHVK